MLKIKGPARPPPLENAGTWRTCGEHSRAPTCGQAELVPARGQIKGRSLAGYVPCPSTVIPAGDGGRLRRLSRSAPRSRHFTTRLLGRQRKMCPCPQFATWIRIAGQFSRKLPSHFCSPPRHAPARAASSSAPIPHEEAHGYEQRYSYDRSVCKHQSSHGLRPQFSGRWPLPEYSRGLDR